MKRRDDPYMIYAAGGHEAVPLELMRPSFVLHSVNYGKKNKSKRGSQTGSHHTNNLFISWIKKKMIKNTQNLINRRSVECSEVLMVWGGDGREREGKP